MDVSKHCQDPGQEAKRRTISLDLSAELLERRSRSQNLDSAYAGPITVTKCEEIVEIEASANQLSITIMHDAYCIMYKKYNMVIRQLGQRTEAK